MWVVLKPISACALASTGWRPALVGGHTGWLAHVRVCVACGDGSAGAAVASSLHGGCCCKAVAADEHGGGGQLLASWGTAPSARALRMPRLCLVVGKHDRDGIILCTLIQDVEQQHPGGYTGSSSNMLLPAQTSEGKGPTTTTKQRARPVQGRSGHAQPLPWQPVMHAHMPTMLVRTPPQALRIKLQQAGTRRQTAAKHFMRSNCTLLKSMKWVRHAPSDPQSASPHTTVRSHTTTRWREALTSQSQCCPCPVHRVVYMASSSLAVSLAPNSTDSTHLFTGCYCSALGPTAQTMA